jgi:hypothetical protein
MEERTEKIGPAAIFTRPVDAFSPQGTGENNFTPLLQILDG